PRSRTRPARCLAAFPDSNPYFQRGDEARALAARTSPLTAVDHPLRRALPLFLGAGLCFTTLDTIAKFLVRDHALLVVVWARYAGQMAAVTPYARHRVGPGFWRTRNLRMQLLRSAMLLAATLSFFGALRYLPLAEGSAISSLAPVVVVFLSPWILGERPGRARVVAALVGFAGVLLLLRPGSAVLHPAALLLFVSATCNAFYAMLTRRLPGDSPYTTLFYSALVGTIALTPLLPFVAIPTAWSWTSAGLFALLGVFAGSGHALLTRAFLRAPASLLAPFGYLQIVWATLYGFLVFDQFPDGWSFTGMAVIVASGVALAWQERVRASHSGRQR
ncbi:MAG: DMT family transporter, partial [Betaproteobacteria bacterium PRO3]|nr:DMT family transporter [Betaproteobacteria bacterium PRO3]